MGEAIPDYGYGFGTFVIPASVVLPPSVVVEVQGVC